MQSRAVDFEITEQDYLNIVDTLLNSNSHELLTENFRKISNYSPFLLINKRFQ